MAQLETATQSATAQRGHLAGGIDGDMAPRAGGHPSAEGAPSSNTAPSTCNNDSHTRVLRCGVDSLYLSYPGELSSESAVRLKTLKGLAQSRDPEKQQLAQLELGHHLFRVHDRGKFPYEFIFSDRWYRAQIAGQAAQHTPLAYVQLRSEPLTFEGPHAVEADLSGVIGSLGLLGGRPTVSRVDLCVDFVTSTVVGDLDEAAFVTRARGMSRHSVSRRFSGFSISLGGKLSARLYDKTLEIEGSGKEYMRQVWRDLGWDGEQQVWRLEFQFEREALRQLGIVSFDDLMASLGGLWNYASTEWLRLTIPNPQDATQSRWPLHPMWEVLQAADWGTEAPVSRQCTPKGSPPSDRYLFINGLAGPTAYMAREGITDAGEGAKAFFRAARTFHEDRAYLTGLSFDDYVEQKVRLKMRQYGTAANPPPEGSPHPADQAVADEYRRRSDGA